MNSSVSCSVASSLRPYDQTAATVVYGGGGACNAPSIVTQPETRNISVGQVAQLSVGTAGTSPFTYAWFAGNPGNTTQPLAGSSASLTVAPAVTTTYWVRVSNCSTQVANSVGATVFVSCAAPSILTHPAGTTLTQGTGTTLRVSATGSSLQYQWYQGATGDTRQPLGDNSSSLVVAPSSSTQYWVRITGACGIPVSSQHATVTVVPAATTNLFMLNRRFNVQVRYRNQFANPVSEGLLTGKSLQASALSETSTFWFNSPLVVELVVRISDARPFDNAFHVYLGGLSDVEFFVTVRDTLTGKSVEYHKGANSLAGKIDRTSFPAGTSLGDALDSLTASASSFRPAPNADPSTLRVLSRYDVRVRYRNQFASPAREGYLLGRSIAKVESTETAVFYFENPESVEWIVRFTDVRPFANRVDFFHGGVSDVQYTVEVTDTVTGAQRTYGVAPFSVAGGVDRQSFTP
jgi:hypothetical protein